MSNELIYLILISGLTGALAGLVRLVTSSEPTTSRTMFSHTTSGFMVASAGASLMFFYTKDMALCYAVSVFLGMLGEQAIIATATLAVQWADKRIRGDK